MWMLFHRKASTKVVRDGESFIQACPECGVEATFHEVEVSEKFGMFFVLDVVGDKQRAYRCGECGEVFDARDEPAAEVPPIPARTAAQQVRDRAAEETRRLEAAEAKAIQIEDELAELKKRLGR